MATPFQIINSVIQTAVSSARSFIESNDGQITQDDLDEWLTFTFSEEELPEEVRELYDDVVTAIIKTYQILEDEEED